MEQNIILDKELLEIVNRYYAQKGGSGDKKKNMTKDEANEFIDNYFAKLEIGVISALKELGIIHDLILKTADDQNLEFGEEIQEASQIEVGTSGVKIDGKPANGNFVMPDGTTLEIKEGVVKKIKEPTPEEIVDSIRQTMGELRNQIKALKAAQGRVPFRETSYLKRTK